MRRSLAMGSRGALRACSVDLPADQRLLDTFLLAQGWLCVYKKGNKGLKNMKFQDCLSPCTDSVISLLRYLFCFQAFCVSVPLEELVPRVFCLWLIDAGVGSGWQAGVCQAALPGQQSPPAGAVKHNLSTGTRRS